MEKSTPGQVKKVEGLSAEPKSTDDKAPVINISNPSPSKFTKDEEIRLRCIEAAAKANSGTQYFQAPSIVINAAKAMETYVKEG